MKRHPWTLLAVLCWLSATVCGCGSKNTDAQDKWDRARLAGFNEFRNDQYDQAIEHYRQAIDAARALAPGDRRVPLTLNDLARVFLAKGEFEDASRTYQSALDALKQPQADKSGGGELIAARCEALDGLGNSLSKLGKNEQAERCYKEALVQANQNKLGEHLRSITFDYRSFLKQQGENDRADALTEQGEAVATAAVPLPVSGDDAKYQMEVHVRLGDTAFGRGDMTKAQAEFKTALDAAQRVGEKTPRGDCASRMGQVAYRQGRWKEAKDWFDYAMKNYYEGRAGVIARRAAVCGLAMTLCKLKNYDQAEFCAKQLIADSKWIPTKDGRELREGLQALNDIYQESGQPEKAIEPLQQMYDSYRQYQPITHPGCTMGMCYLSTQVWNLKKKDQARKIIDDYTAEALRATPAQLVLPGRLLDDYADAFIKSKEFDKALIYSGIAHKLLAKAPQSEKEMERCQALMHRAASGS